MKRRHSEKLTEQFMGSYKMKRIISTNAIELELSSTIKIHPVVNISRVHMYKDQVEGQKKEQSLLVIVKGKEEYKVEKILNKRKFREKDRYLVQWKGYTVEEDTQEPRENLGNARDLVERFEEEYGKESRQARKEDCRKFHRGELLERYIAKTLYRWDDKRFDQEYWEQLERNWRHWKGTQRRRTLEMIQEEEEKQERERPRVEEWNKEDEIDNLQDPYNEL